MGEAINVFLTGSFGVFTGMAVLYCSIKLTGAAVTAFELHRLEKGSAADPKGKGAK